MKPNILFLFSDQHNARCLSCEEHPDVKTPNLDRLASEGIRFRNAYTNNPICTPSRISFLSGLYPSTHGYYGLYGRAPEQPMTSIFKYFKDNGYRTGALGKLHTPRYWIEKDCQFIYDEFIEYPKYLEGAGLYEYNDNRDCSNYNSVAETSMIPLEYCCETALAKQAIRFIRNEGELKDRGDPAKPWFAWVSFSRPHQPHTPSEPFATMYAEEKLLLPPVSDNENKRIRALRKNINEMKLRNHVGKYLGLISQVDYGIGIILEELKKQYLLDNTIILYSSDHGDYAGEHGVYEKVMGISYRAITRIPMIMHYPDQVYKGRVSDEIIEAVDVFPTLCEFAGLEISNTIQGISFADIVKGKPAGIRTSALTENPYRKSLATKTWRYVLNLYGEEEDELYNVKDDPWELENRIHDPAYRDIAQELQRELIDRVIKARKPINVLNGGWHNHVYDLDGRIDLNRCGAVNNRW